MRTAERTHALFDGREVYRDLIEALQLTPKEVQEVNGALADAFAQIEEIESKTVEVTKDKHGLNTWAVPPYPVEGQQIRDAFENRLFEILGEDRGDYARMTFGHSFYFANRGQEGVRLRFRAGSDPTMSIFTGVRGGVMMLSRFDKDPPIGSITGAVLEREFGHLVGDVEEVRRSLESIKGAP